MTRPSKYIAVGIAAAAAISTVLQVDVGFVPTAVTAVAAMCALYIDDALQAYMIRSVRQELLSKDPTAGEKPLASFRALERTHEDVVEDSGTGHVQLFGERFPLMCHVEDVQYEFLQPVDGVDDSVTGTIVAAVGHSFIVLIGDGTAAAYEDAIAANQCPQLQGALYKQVIPSVSTTTETC